ncbi:hypothetical protein AMECASPLE_028784 [Ameca splendens]|uniref:Uncharacterized protein n=1 Tax=Ameca splendens TaxID=208324 RepID=A0ABV1ABX8_9TELE
MTALGCVLLSRDTVCEVRDGKYKPFPSVFLPEIVCVAAHPQEGGRESKHLCVSICVWVATNALGVLLGAQMVPRPATAAPTMATFSHGTLSFLDPTPPVQA